MGVDSQHPSYVTMLPLWQKLDDCYRGEECIKSKTTEYLPATSGHFQDGYPNGEPGISSYNAYLTRATFRESVRDAVEALVGVMHREPAKIKLPKGMEKMLQSATLRKEPMELLLRRINEAQLVPGRMGLLFDLKSDGTPYISTYDGRAIINWDEDLEGYLNLVVLNESGKVRDDETFEWQDITRYLVLRRRNGGYEVEAHELEGGALQATEVKLPSMFGNRAKEIPFVFVNPSDLSPEPAMPPLLGLANLSISDYRQDADYKQALFMQGQDTLVMAGGEVKEGDAQRVGAGALIKLEAEGEAYYIGTESKGIPEMRLALEYLRREILTKSSQLLSDSRHREAAEALSIRTAARTSNLVILAKTGAAALETVLKKGAVLMGLNPDEVSVEPSYDFLGHVQDSKDLKALVEAKKLGAPISWKSIHKVCADREFTELSWDEELKLLVEEAKEEALKEKEQEKEENADQSDLRERE
jgi:hypothetical protein